MNCWWEERHTCTGSKKQYEYTLRPADEVRLFDRETVHDSSTLILFEFSSMHEGVPGSIAKEIFLHAGWITYVVPQSARTGLQGCDCSGTQDAAGARGTQQPCGGFC
jgi:hypothetical protein